MLKKFSLAVLCLVMAGCGTSRINTTGGVRDINTDISEVTLTSDSYQNEQLFRVGMLLPLTGSASSVGKGLKNAALLALDDVQNPNLVLQFYDTRSSQSGARTAIENAISQQSNLIVGPLMSTEVQASSGRAVSDNIPMIAFSTSKDVLQPGVYTLGLLVDEQVERIMNYAAAEGRSRFALLVPDNNLGISVARAAVRTAHKNGTKVVRIAFYPPNTSNFSEILKKLTDYSSRHAEMQRKKAVLKAQAEAGNAKAKRELALIKTTDSSDEVDFDAVLIPESGAKLKSAISMFGYYDIYAPKVKFLGTSIWENTRLNKESLIVNSWYPRLSRYQSGYFADKYYKFYGERPRSLYSFAYDAVALASALSKYQGDNMNAAITSPEGFMGINGAFRFFEDGSNQHSLDIMEIKPQGDVVVDAAPKKFDVFDYNISYNNAVYDFSEEEVPLIFGKDPALARSQIYAR